MLVGVFALVAAAGLFWLAYRRPRPRRWLIPRRQRVPVGSAPVGAADSVRLPSADPCELEAELARPLGRDAAEQAARWAEAATALRKANRIDALPVVLRCADAAAQVPHGTLLAAEAVGFPNFPATLHDLAADDGRLAVRALARAARGARDGAVDLAALVRAGLGDHLAVVSETAPAVPDPWTTAAVVEAGRAARRAAHWARLLPPDARPLAERQGLRLEASAARRRVWLRRAVAGMIARFPAAAADEQTAILRTLDDLRADTSVLFPALPDRRAAWWADAVRGLRWATARRFGPLLAAQADRLMASRRPGSAAIAVLTALGGAIGAEAEAALLTAVRHADGAVRRAGVAALGWAEPCDIAAVVGALHAARHDADGGVRRAAVAALARFGELAALNEFARGFVAEDGAVRLAALLAAAENGISWLWPDLDLMADADDPDAALASAEAVERMREAALGLLG